MYTHTESYTGILTSKYVNAVVSVLCRKVCSSDLLLTAGFVLTVVLDWWVGDGFEKSYLCQIHL